MSSESPPTPAPAKRRLRRRLGRGCAWGCASATGLLLVLIGGLVILLGRVPASYPTATRPLPPPRSEENRPGGGLDGFNSPYLGHTGSWNGQGGAWGGGSKTPDLEKETAMGLRWTFMPVYWRALEPDGPVDLSLGTPDAWLALDAFVVEARKRRLNVLMQAPVVGGNAGGPPFWAGRRQKGRSAPDDMEALAAFAGKLAERYRPDGTLARREGWGPQYGVRAWELDNEPESYLTHWKGQAADYAEFVTRAAQRIKAADPEAVIVAPGLAAGRDGLSWLEAALNAPAKAGSPAFQQRGTPYSIGPAIDVVSVHNYEGLDSAFSGGSRTIGQVLDDVSGVFEKWEQAVPGFTYARKTEYWHTEGNFDFLGILSAERRAAWRFQFLTRALAAGLRKVAVMDASPAEQLAVKAYVAALPDPYPMLPAASAVVVIRGQVEAYRHPDGAAPDAGQVWVVWPVAKTGDATIEIPARQAHVSIVSVKGESRGLAAIDGRVRLEMTGDPKMAAPFLILDRSVDVGR
ncbi:MAG: hypothetical protein ACYC23_24505 [Limisphaerales bacterium]